MITAFGLNSCQCPDVSPVVSALTPEVVRLLLHHENKSINRPPDTLVASPAILVPTREEKNAVGFFVPALPIFS